MTSQDRRTGAIKKRKLRLPGSVSDEALQAIAEKHTSFYHRKNRTADINCLLQMAKKSPVILTTLNITSLLISHLVGNYKNDTYPEYQDHIRQTFKQLSNYQPDNKLPPGIGNPTSIDRLFRQVFFSVAVNGNYLAEIAYQLDSDRLARLARIQPWDLREVSYKVDEDKCELYAEHAGDTENKLYLSPGQCLHMVGLPDLDVGNPDGHSLLETAFDHDKLLKISEDGQCAALHRSIVPLLVGKTDVGKEYQIDEDTTITAGENMLEQMASLNSGGVSVLNKYWDADQGEYVEDEIDTLPLPIDYDGIIAVTEHAERNVALALHFPLSLIVPSSSTGSGDSNLAKTQRELYMLYVLSTASMIAESVIEHVIQPELFFNFGAIDDYGYFEMPTLQEAIGLDDVPSMINALVGALNQDGLDDEIVAKLREGLNSVI